MKRALILHGTDDDSQKNWFPWLKGKLERDGYGVWCPDLPGAQKPNVERYSRFIFDNKDFSFEQDTIIVGHSSGAVAALGLLEALPKGTVIKAAYLVGVFKDDLGWEALKELFVKPFDFEQIKPKSRLWYFIHSDNDPYCPLEHAEYLHQKIGGDLIVLPGQKHFSVGTAGEHYRQFEYLYHLIAEDSVNAEAVVELFEAMEQQSVTLWLDGGWGVDALLQKQTREHGDIDVAVQKKDVDTLVGYLKDTGYWEIKRGDTSEHNFMLGNDQAQLVDIHVIELDEQGNGSYGPKEAEATYPKEALAGQGKVGGKEVRCISPEWVVKFHSGYAKREKDYQDVLAVCEAFGIEAPQEYLDR